MNFLALSYLGYNGTTNEILAFARKRLKTLRHPIANTDIVIKLEINHHHNEHQECLHCARKMEKYPKEQKEH